MFNVLVELESFRGLMSVDDVAKLLKRSTCTIYRMARKRQIPSMMFGGTRCFDPSVLARWLAKKYPELLAAARDVQNAA